MRFCGSVSWATTFGVSKQVLRIVFLFDFCEAPSDLRKDLGVALASDGVAVDRFGLASGAHALWHSRLRLAEPVWLSEQP